MTKLFIKNMVCRRCILSVEQVLKKHGIAFSDMALGMVTLREKPDAQKMETLRADLEALGFELLDDQRSQLIDQVKTRLIEQVQSGLIPEHFTLSDFVKKSLLRDYSSISKLFSEVEGQTMEQFFILQKIEKVKELLVYDEYSLSEIAFQLGYSSVAYLSNQFKKVTGMTPTQFKQNHSGKRRGLDTI
ncbi:MAG: AraC family transcriptional regulator [Saprospiraceae bacterium]|nr:helix-turn-helix transcriptional regulator [Lewinellaceae bacterium]